MANEPATPPEGKTPEGAGPGEPKTYTQEEWDGLQSKLNKRMTLLEKQRDALDAEKSDLLAYKDSVEEVKGKTDEELIKLRQEHARKIKGLDRREAEIASRELRLNAEGFAKEYGVSVEELLEFKTPIEMELYALKASMNKKDGQKPPPPKEGFDRRSGSAGTGSPGLDSLRSEDTSKMTHEAAEKHSKDFAGELAKEWNRRR